MTETEEVQKSTAAQPAKEKKTKAVPVKKPKASKTAAHPPYFEMIKEALVALKEKSGSSPYAIAKYMEEKHKAVLPANFRKILGLQLKNSATRGKLIKIKASYKLSESGKKEKKVTAAKPAVKKAAAKPAVKKTAKVAAVAAGTKRKAETVKKAKATVASAGAKKKAETGKKKVAAKKATPAKAKATPAKAKAPKSIKSPAAKRAKRSVGA